MVTIRVCLALAVLVLLGLIFYSEWSGQSMEGWLKGLSSVCIGLYVVFLWVKYRKKNEK